METWSQGVRELKLVLAFTDFLLRFQFDAFIGVTIALDNNTLGYSRHRSLQGNVLKRSAVGTDQKFRG
jgi:hypothetical protein